MKNTLLFLGLLFIITIGLVAGCGGNSEDSLLPTEDVRIIVNSQTFIYTAGVTEAPFEGICLGSYSTTNRTYIYGSGSPVADPALATARIMIYFNGNSVGTYSAGVNWLNNGLFESSDSASVIITQYDTVGGKIKGTFSATFGEKENVNTVTGSFNVKRYADNAFAIYLQ